MIELIYKQNLPINIFWDEKKPSLLPENLLSQKINGFCSSLYNEAIESINKEINKSSDSTIIIYSEEYKSFIKSLELLLFSIKLTIPWAIVALVSVALAILV